jgi:4-hydroxybenzoate-CoA ligase
LNAVDWFIDRHVRDGHGARIAFRDPWRSIDYAGLQVETGRFAAALHAAGIKRERRIALIMLDTIDFPIAFWGAIRAGVIPIPVNTLLTPEQIGYVLTDSRAEGAIVSASLAPGLAGMLKSQQLVVLSNPDAEPGDGEMRQFLDGVAPLDEPVQVSPDEVGFWLYSSGSTGAPKGVKHVHGSLRATADTYGAQVLEIAPDDVVFSAAKLFFAYGLGNAMTFPMSVGASSVLLPDRPTPVAVLDVMTRHRPTIFGGVPTLYAALLNHPRIGPGAGSDRLRRCISAGEALPEAIGRRWSNVVGADILDGIGSTEMLHIFLSNRPDAIRYGTTGLPVPGYELRVVDAAGHDLPDGEPGELLVRGPSSAEGYWNQRSKSQRTFAGEWTRTGDTYIREPDGTYRCCGRADDMMKVGGIWVSPTEVEDALAAHSAVLEAAVVGREDADGLIKPKAFVVLKDPDAPPPPDLHEQLKEHVKSRIGPWKYPRWVEVVEALPKTATGKIQRFKLRQPGA